MLCWKQVQRLRVNFLIGVIVRFGARTIDSLGEETATRMVFENNSSQFLPGRTGALPVGEDAVDLAYVNIFQLRIVWKKEGSFHIAVLRV